MISNISDESSYDYLYNSFLQLETAEEVREFLEDICTVPEIRAMAQRLSVARMLYSNHVYNDIVEETGASTATISRVNRTLNDGHDNAFTGKGYKRVLGRMGETDAKSRRKKK
ncbi:MAG: TrpR-like protein, YerC/YecD [Oscillospiraceae bacterium]|nr:TrpR-like protein, YerC/YecD [Oscillospiraceae bacterium]